MARCQQDEIYEAEGEVLHRGMTFVDEDDAQTYVDALRDTWWWNTHFWAGPARVEIYWRSGGNQSVGEYVKSKDAGLIEMVEEDRCELYILHEIAHVIAACIHGSEAHDPHFARVYAVLVYCTLGSGAWLELKRAFDKHGVDYMQNN
jgi:putative metallohydrolase (TIGR04338 family)